MSAGSELRIAVSEIIFQINREMLGKSERGLNILRNEAVEVLSREGSGRRYGKHRASAPGQTPAPDKGNLRRNWSQEKTASANGLGKGIRIRLRIKSRMHYADYLEFGTRKMAPRPYREKIKSQARPKIAAIMG